MLTRRRLMLSIFASTLLLGVPERGRGATIVGRRKRWYGHNAVGAKIASESALDFPAPAEWLKVELGMSEEEVLRILGRPIVTEPPAIQVSENTTVMNRWRYGRLPVNDPSVPCGYLFNVYFHHGQVKMTEQPFDADDPTVLQFPKPSMPRLIYPSRMEKFHHYPRIVDFRWQPSVGAYPIRYCVDISVEHQTVDGQIEEEPIEQIKVDIPYLCTGLPGKGRYRWRVKAKNTHGESDWTKAVPFACEH
jgi:hypothetical protein